MSINVLFLEFKLLALSVRMCCCGVYCRFGIFFVGRLKLRPHFFYSAACCEEMYVIFYVMAVFAVGS